MCEETTFDAINRLQQEFDRTEKMIEGKRGRITKNRLNGPLCRQIESEIQQLIDSLEAIRRNILQLKSIKTN